MRRLILFLSFLLVNFTLSAQSSAFLDDFSKELDCEEGRKTLVYENSPEYNELIKIAEKTYREGDYKTSVELYENAFSISKESSADLYNGGCSAALSNDSTKAFHFLNLAADNGFKKLGRIQSDCDLRSLRNSPSWVPLLYKIRDNEEDYHYNSGIITSVFKSIEENNTDSIWALTNCSFKKDHDRDTFNAQIKGLNAFMKKNELSPPQKTGPIATSSSYQSDLSGWPNGRLTHIRTYRYFANPKLLGGETTHLNEEIGYEIELDVIGYYGSKKWLICNLDIKNNYFEKSFNCKDYINNYFDDTTKLTCRLEIIKPEREIVYDSEDTISAFSSIEPLVDIQWHELKYFPKSEDEIIYKIHFKKKLGIIREREHWMGLSALNIFFKGQSDYMIISNGTKYGVYQGKTKKIKAWVLEQIKKGII
ncbi:hypothetical protein FUAX_07030 [Fulvitalea axinellae]|uniref:Tetratricopeptide repeat protein n=1 Tax=Fulvitalea axinellae TaxID=1182444 RepID=A0AAU9C840_9BACT|nr:hypothetical protein FUAX_07030 [Fulvitalea axinellae]